MPPLVAIRTCLRKYATFSGRASRSEFWWFVLPLMAVYLGGSFLIEQLYFAEANGTAEALNIALVGLSVALFLPFAAVTLRRFHDVGLSGWWLLAIWGAAFAAEAATTYQDAITVMTTDEEQARTTGISVNPLFAGLLLLTALLYIAEIVICLLPSQKKNNRFGPPPLTSSNGPNPHEVTP